MQERMQPPPQKLAETGAPIHELLRDRWSPRAFADRPLALTTIRSLLEAARWAPSSFNEQPWRFLVTRQGEAAHEGLLQCLTERNRAWARRAPVLLLTVAKLTFSDDGSANRHAAHDVGQAIAQLTVQATALGLGVHQMAGFSLEQARQQFEIPEGFEPMAVAAIGYPDDPAVLPGAFQERERAARRRKPLGELVFTERWGRPSPDLSSP